MNVLATGFHLPGLNANLKCLTAESHRRIAFNGFDHSRLTTPSLRSSSEAESERSSQHFADCPFRIMFVLV